ncbi:MAG: IS1634 family transposase [Anaerolineae bacterium]|jgi:transposase
MPVKSKAEYDTIIVGAAYLVKGILQRLGFVSIVDEALQSQPVIETTYGNLAQIMVANRLAFQPVPLYHLSAWAAEHGMTHVFGIKAEWLDDDRMGALLEGLADHQVSIWSGLVGNALRHYKIAPEFLHADTTSVYFEGQYEDEDGQSRQEEGERVPMLVEGYNKDGQRNKVQLVLSLITSGRVPLWYRPWDGNQTDDAVYLADMSALRELLVTDNTVLIGDRKLCNEETMVTFCRQKQLFIGAHPWTDTAKAAWLEAWQALQSGRLSWSDVDYVSRNNARKPAEKRPRYQVCEVVHEMKDERHGIVYPLRWVFVCSSDKAQRDSQQRAKAIQAGEEALQRIAGLLGKYDYTSRKTIEARIEKALCKAGGRQYFTYTLSGTDEDQDWRLDWQRSREAIAQAERFDGIALLCTNVPPERLTAGEVMVKYKEQVNVEQSIDFIKSPIQVRPMWLHSLKRLAGLLLLIMVAVLVAMLLEHQVRRWIARTGKLLKGLMPEGRDNPYPTAKAMLRAFQSYALVVVRRDKGHRVYYPKLRSVQQQIWDIMELAPLPG